MHLHFELVVKNILAIEARNAEEVLLAVVVEVDNRISTRRQPLNPAGREDSKSPDSGPQRYIGFISGSDKNEGLLSPKNVSVKKRRGHRGGRESRKLKRRGKLRWAMTLDGIMKMSKKASTFR